MMAFAGEEVRVSGDLACSWERSRTAEREQDSRDSEELG